MPENSRFHPGCPLLIAGFLLLFQIITAVNVLQLPDAIAARLVFPPVLQAGLALLWAMLFGAVIVALVRRKANALGYTGWLVIAFIIYQILRLVFFAQSDYERGRLPFTVISMLLLLTVPIIVLLRSRSSHK